MNKQQEKGATVHPLFPSAEQCREAAFTAANLSRAFSALGEAAKSVKFPSKTSVVDQLRRDFRGNVGRRFVKVQMNGCMGDVRGDEKHGTIIKRGMVSVYAGTMRPYDMYTVRYDDGTENIEPTWGLSDMGSHLEYQT